MVNCCVPGSAYSRLCKESKCELPYDSIGQTAEESMAGENSSHKYAAVTIQLCL